MANKVEDEVYLVFVERHIEELKERVIALKSRMSEMVLEKYETANQEILLANMLEVQKNMECFQAELITAFKATYPDS